MLKNLGVHAAFRLEFEDRLRLFLDVAFSDALFFFRQQQLRLILKMAHKMRDTSIDRPSMRPNTQQFARHWW